MEKLNTQKKIISRQQQTIYNQQKIIAEQSKSLDDQQNKIDGQDNIIVEMVGTIMQKDVSIKDLNDDLDRKSIVLNHILHLDAEHAHTSLRKTQSEQLRLGQPTSSLAQGGEGRLGQKYNIEASDSHTQRHTSTRKRKFEYISRPSTGGAFYR